jgi:hypothetical protein
MRRDPVTPPAEVSARNFPSKSALPPRTGDAATTEAPQDVGRLQWPLQIPQTEIAVAWPHVGRYKEAFKATRVTVRGPAEKPGLRMSGRRSHIGACPLPQARDLPYIAVWPAPAMMTI